MVSRSLSLFKWLFCRLPIAFSLPFTAISLWWVFYGFKKLNDLLAGWSLTVIKYILESQIQIPKLLSHYLIVNLADFLHALLVICLFFLGFLVAYNTSVLLNWILFKLKLKPIFYHADTPQIPSPAVCEENPFDKVKRIGIVLAGGGAKGAFQAGAMKAIYHYLSDHNALEKVKVISGTSIGSWNALFWLSDLIKPEKGWQDQSIHEKWWRRISAKSLAAPSWYIPFFRNAFLSSEPWQQVFDYIFGRAEVMKRISESDIHFYLTRSNVRSGELECATNNPQPTPIARVSYDFIDRSDQNSFLRGLKAGVFASMDLPPLFPYFQRDNKSFEDGGIIDNLPIIFPAMEGCDLIFILPLNSDFEEEPNDTSVIARLFRVMEVRQGALERNGFKILYLFNELAALRNYTDKLPATAHPVCIDSNSTAVCPHKAFVQTTINTQELWKRKEAGIAFDVMRQATSDIISGFRFDQKHDTVRVALISRGGNVYWDERF